MCAEHGVLQAVCTKCHPKLIPIFQSKGDWCAEHELPESVCPICHPERGGRPAVEVSADEAPADETLVRFKTLETARQAGIEVVPAVQAADASGVAATATIVADVANVAVINARAAGVVQSVRVDVGTVVQPGSPLAVIESAQVGEERSKLRAVRTRARVAEANYRREQELYEKGISSFKEVQLAEQDWETAKAELSSALTALQMMGAEGGDSGKYTLRAPIGGVVTKRLATVGTLVDLEEPLFEVVNPTSLWADIDVPEVDAARVMPGQRVGLRLEGLPEREFQATVGFVSPVIDPQTRTARVRAKLLTPDPALRANMYARAHIFTNASTPAVAVPRAAVQEAKGVAFVFVRLAEDRFELRRVKVAGRAGDQVMLQTGVLPGEIVVTTGSFLLKTETMKEGIGAGCCEVEPPKS
jgi:cobalt-zinc-cadmium efflux system membrane fusion protein